MVQLLDFLDSLGIDEWWLELLQWGGRLTSTAIRNVFAI
jgi:hypothetical protein